MNKRRLLKTVFGAVVVAITGGTWFTLRGRATFLSFSALPESMMALYDPKFVKAFPGLSTHQLLTELGRRGVYGRRTFYVSQIRVNASSDVLAEFDNFLYTESELLLYATIARWSAAGRILLE